MEVHTESRKTSEEAKDIDLSDGPRATSEAFSIDAGTPDYRLYKRRFIGMAGLESYDLFNGGVSLILLQLVLNFVSAMAWVWFGPISNNMVAEFGITLDEVNWLGNSIACAYLPISLAIPEVIRRYGIRRCCDIGAAALIVSAWIRYAATAHSLSTKGAYALLIIGQLFAAIAQPIFQIIGPKFSETWFDLKGRTTATMIIGIANPIGGAVGQLLSPSVGDTRKSILVLGIIASVGAPFVLLISAAPPTPPTYSASRKAPGIFALVRVMLNKGRLTDGSMSVQERIDFAILTCVFGVLAAASNVFGFLNGEILHPVGYSAGVAGLMGATLILSGIAAAIVSAPLFDRVITLHLAIAAKILVPLIGASWLAFTWVVRPNNAGAVYALCALIGIGSITMLPIALELACEVTRNADGSSALLWFACYAFVIVFILVEGALRAGPDESPPLNMHRALIFNGAVITGICTAIFFLRGKQVRKQLDQEKLEQSRAGAP